jgi:Ca2+-binding RTX toxin-like protein
MSTIVLSGSSPVNFTEFNLNGDWKDSSPVYNDDEVAIIFLSGGANLVIEGSGFGNFDQHGYPTSGTVTGFTIYSEFFQAKFTDFSISASNFQTIWRTANEKEFTELFFGGDDEIFANDAGVVISGFDGDDVLVGGKAADTLAGADGDDEMRGGKGADNFLGGKGSDLMQGGRGDDSFIFAKTSDSQQGRGIDRINDLTNSDRIDLSAIDADATTSPANETFVIVSAFTNDPGQLVLQFKPGKDRTEFKGDTDGDGSADFVIYASGNHEDFSNFTL